jgi:hypothetical protein
LDVGRGRCHVAAIPGSTAAHGPRRWRVTLYWDDCENTLTVEVEDFTSPARDHALIGIPPADARLAFEHPFAYALSVP